MKNIKDGIEVKYSQDLEDFCLEKIQSGCVFGFDCEIPPDQSDNNIILINIEEKVERFAQQIKNTLCNFRNRKKHGYKRRLRAKIEEALRQNKLSMDIANIINNAELTSDIKEQIWRCVATEVNAHCEGFGEKAEPAIIKEQFYLDSMGLNKENAKVVWENGKIAGAIPKAKVESVTFKGKIKPELLESAICQVKKKLKNQERYLKDENK